jgi:ribosomal protein L37E
MTYVECPQCGRKALSVATRCPHCGVAFPSEPLRRYAQARPHERLRPALVAGAILLLGVTVLLALPRMGSKRIGEPPAQAGDGPSEGAPPVAASAEATEDAAATSDAAAAPGAAGAPSAARPPSIRRYARTWVHIRGARTRAAPSVLVLDPAAPVQLDSLVRGWYRVLIDGRAAGYVHHSNLDRVPPPR